MIVTTACTVIKVARFFLQKSCSVRSSETDLSIAQSASGHWGQHARDYYSTSPKISHHDALESLAPLFDVLA
jgi:hypothetical protein